MLEAKDLHGPFVKSRCTGTLLYYVYTQFFRLISVQYSSRLVSSLRPVCKKVKHGGSA